MKRLIIICLFSLVSFSSLNADFSFEFVSNQYYTDNLLNDANSRNDSYILTKAKLLYYPISNLEINLNSDYSYYNRLVDLGSNLLGAGITYIPTSQESPISVYLSANYNSRSYRTIFEKSDVNNFDLAASLGFKLTNKVHLRSGLNFKNTKYPNEINVDRDIYEIFAGGNFTLPGNNSFDLEMGYSLMNHNFLDPEDFFDPELEGPFEARFEGTTGLYYISPRFSRPIGSKTGISIIYLYKGFVNNEDKVVFGATYSGLHGDLSPYATIWEGNRISINLKSYIIPTIVSSGGIGYWDKKYLRSWEIFSPPVQIRRDYQTRYFLNFTRPIKWGILLEPTLDISYTDSKSTVYLYNYQSFSIGLSLKFRL